MERPRDPLFDLVVGLREDVVGLRKDVIGLRQDVAELKAASRHGESGLAELRQDVRRLDGRIDQIFLVQLAMLGTLLASIATVLVTSLTG